MNIQDAIIPFHPKDKAIVEMCCESLRNVMGIQRIFLISSEDPNIPNTSYIDERSIKNIISVEEIENYWKSNNGKWSSRAGWIYQQLLEIGTSLYIDDLSEDYMTCDSDIVFLKNPYLNINKTGVFPYNKAYTGEYHPDYRSHYERLMKEPTTAEISFINHHMIHNKYFMNELKSFIESKHNKRWDLAILHTLNLNNFSGFACDDLYGNYMIKYHADKCIKTDIKIKDITWVPTKTELSTVQHDYHIISCQHYRRVTK